MDGGSKFEREGAMIGPSDVAGEGVLVLVLPLTVDPLDDLWLL